MIPADRHRYHNPEDDSLRPDDRLERQIEHADFLRDERRDRAAEESLAATQPSPEP